MSVRIQVILGEEEAVRFRSQAKKETKSLSAWLRDAGKKVLEDNRQQDTLKDIASLETFFRECKDREKGSEPDWETHKSRILEGHQPGNQA
jgi:hypothetical protein